MSRQVAYKCHHCGSRAKVRYVENISDKSVKAVCQCQNEACQAEMSFVVTYLADIKKPIQAKETACLAFF